MKGLTLLTVAAVLGAAACDTPCSAGTCGGCCVQGVCYLQGCGTGGGGGGGLALNTGGGCASRSTNCASQPCCSVDEDGDPLTCTSKYCEKSCKSSGACSSNSQCCAAPKYVFGYYCRQSSNSCTICGNTGQRCYQLPDDCCPGLRCGSKPATPNYYECMP